MFGRSAEAAKRFCFATLGAIRIALGLHHKTLVRDFALKVYRVLGWLLMCPLPQQDRRKRSQQNTQIRCDRLITQVFHVEFYPLRVIDNIAPSANLPLTG